MGHLSYEEGKKVVFKGLIILGIVTLVEVFVALLGKGYIIDGFHLPVWLMYLLMISMSLYKAYFIVYEFMHMKYEVPGLVKSVLLPTLLLTWMLIAFFSEADTWRKWRAQVNDKPIAAFSAPAAETHHDTDHKDGTPSEVEGHAAPVDSMAALQDTTTAPVKNEPKADEHH